MLEQAQTYKKNRDFIVMKNLIVLLTVLFTWFCFGFAIAFGTDNKADNIQFRGFHHGWFGDFSGGLVVNETSGLVVNETSIINMQVFPNITKEASVS